MTTATLGMLGAGGPLLAELHNPSSGRLDAARLAAFLRVPLAQVASAIGRKYQSVYKTPDAATLQPGLAGFQRVLATLVQVSDDPTLLRAWLNVPLRELNDRTPLQVMLDGHADVIAGLVADTMAGVPG